MNQDSLIPDFHEPLFEQPIVSRISNYAVPTKFREDGQRQKGNMFVEEVINTGWTQDDPYVDPFKYSAGWSEKDVAAPPRKDVDRQRDFERSFREERDSLKHSRNRSRSRERKTRKESSRERQRTRSRTRKRSRSRDRKRSRSRSRDRKRSRSRSRDRKRSRSRSGDRERSRKRSKERSGWRSKDSSRDRSRDRKRSDRKRRSKSRSRSREHRRSHKRSRSRSAKRSHHRKSHGSRERRRSSGRDRKRSISSRRSSDSSRDHRSRKSRRGTRESSRKEESVHVKIEPGVASVGFLHPSRAKIVEFISLPPTKSMEYQDRNKNAVQMAPPESVKRESNERTLDNGPVNGAFIHPSRLGRVDHPKTAVFEQIKVKTEPEMPSSAPSGAFIHPARMQMLQGSLDHQPSVHKNESKNGIKKEVWSSHSNQYKDSSSHPRHESHGSGWAMEEPKKSGIVKKEPRDSASGWGMETNHEPERKERKMSEPVVKEKLDQGKQTQKADGWGFDGKELFEPALQNLGWGVFTDSRDSNEENHHSWTNEVQNDPPVKVKTEPGSSDPHKAIHPMEENHAAIIDRSRDPRIHKNTGSHKPRDKGHPDRKKQGHTSDRIRVKSERPI